MLIDLFDLRLAVNIRYILSQTETDSMPIEGQLAIPIFEMPAEPFSTPR